jgi:two-component system, response regulator PdtaR
MLPATRVVVAEDEAIIRLDLVEMLGELGYDVVGQAADGDAALRIVRQVRPDVALLDVKMPRLDGISAAEQIVAEGLAAVVLVTAFSDRALIERAAQIGAMGYLVKPVGRTDLVPAIEVAVARFAQVRALGDEVSGLKEQVEARKVIERAKGELMTRLRLTEADAFRWLQKRAMDRRTSLIAVATTVLDGLNPLSDNDGGIAADAAASGDD